MKSLIIKACLFSFSLTCLAVGANAQRTSKKKAAQQATGDQTQQQTNVAKQPSGYSPYGNVPIRKDTSNVGYNDSVIKKSWRKIDAFDKNFVNERTPLPYEHLRWDDALYTETVWRELDLREKMNQPFRFDAEDDNGRQMFIDILLKAVRRDSVMAFRDDRFTEALTNADVMNLTSGGDPDTTAVYDINDMSKIKEYVITQKSFDPKAVTKIRIREQWIFDREASRMFVRIIGIAPVKTKYLPSGQEQGSEVMFWVYYPDLRPTLAKFEVYNPKNLGYGRMTWEELFESRMFSSYITKSTLDNPGNKVIRQMIKDPILALLEGDNIKDRIFNYEQDLWSY
jgi:gliding motility associated protien GldN